LTFIYELILPVALLVATYFAIPQVAQLSPSLQELIHYAPYALVLFGMAMGAKFNRSRVLFFLLVMGLGLWAYDAFLASGQQGFVADVVRHGLYYLLPLNILLFFLLRERGIFGFHGVARLILIALQLGAIGWVIESKQEWLLPWAGRELVSVPWLASVALPQPLLILLVLIFLVMLAVSLMVKRSPIETGFLAALVGIIIACLHSNDATAFRLYLGASVLILVISVIQDSHRMAYRDELTGLPGRRALNEYLMGLGRCYTIAMLDVDHFKKFNDTYGHDVGDQVLKMVGSRMREVSGGGKPFRYGGEEFSVIFPGKSLEKTTPYLEALRESIAAYKMQIRGKGRPKKSKEGRKMRSARGGGKSVSVTISIGVAQRDGDARTPESVIKQADKALYKAKKKGRNCLSK
jgi:diguanylate cyclase (GGDEF)-like protein